MADQPAVMPLSDDELAELRARPVGAHCSWDVWRLLATFDALQARIDAAESNDPIAMASALDHWHRKARELEAERNAFLTGGGNPSRYVVMTVADHGALVAERDELRRRADEAERERGVFQREMITNRDRAEEAGRRELAEYREKRRAMSACDGLKQRLTDAADRYHRLANGDEGTPVIRAGAGIAAAEIRVALAALDEGTDAAG